MDEVHVRIRGVQKYVWRGVDQDGQVLDVLVQPRRDGASARRFIQRLTKHATSLPRLVVTDKWRAYIQPCAELLPDARHLSDKGKNNRAENSHQPTRVRERQMKGFKSVGHAQQFLATFSAINNLFDVSGHLLSAKNRRRMLSQRWSEWIAITQSCTV